MKRIFSLLLFLPFCAHAELLQNALGCADSRAAATALGVPVYLYPCHALVRQQFFVHPVNEHYFYLTMPNQACLASDSNKIVLRTCRLNEQELWTYDNGFLRQGMHCLTGDSLKKPLTLTPCENKESSRFQLVPEWYFLQNKRKKQPALKPGEVRQNFGVFAPFPR